VFLEKGPLYLVAVSSADEPESALRLQLDLLHAHFLAILTDNFDKMLARNPRFEPRRLLGTILPHTPWGKYLWGSSSFIFWQCARAMASWCRCGPRRFLPLKPQNARRSHLP